MSIFAGDGGLRLWLRYRIRIALTFTGVSFFDKHPAVQRRVPQDFILLFELLEYLNLIGFQFFKSCFDGTHLTLFNIVTVSIFGVLMAVISVSVLINLSGKGVTFGIVDLRTTLIYILMRHAPSHVLHLLRGRVFYHRSHHVRSILHVLRHFKYLLFSLLSSKLHAFILWTQCQSKKYIF